MSIWFTVDNSICFGAFRKWTKQMLCEWTEKDKHNKLDPFLLANIIHTIHSQHQQENVDFPIRMGRVSVKKWLEFNQQHNQLSTDVTQLKKGLNVRHFYQNFRILFTPYTKCTIPRLIKLTQSQHRKNHCSMSVVVNNAQIFTMWFVVLRALIYPTITHGYELNECDKHFCFYSPAPQIVHTFELFILNLNTFVLSTNDCVTLGILFVWYSKQKVGKNTAGKLWPKSMGRGKKYFQSNSNNTNGTTAYLCGYMHFVRSHLSLKFKSHDVGSILLIQPFQCFPMWFNVTIFQKPIWWDFSSIASGMDFHSMAL